MRVIEVCVEVGADLLVYRNLLVPTRYLLGTY